MGAQEISERKALLKIEENFFDDGVKRNIVARELDWLQHMEIYLTYPG